GSDARNFRRREGDLPSPESGNWKVAFRLHFAGRRGPAAIAGPSGPCSASATLLDLDGGAGLLELGLELVGLFAVDALLDGLRGLVDERLGLLEAEAGRSADDLDDLDLLVAGAREDDVDRRGLVVPAGVAAAAG